MGVRFTPLMLSQAGFNESQIIDTQNNLIIEIESFRLRRMLNGDYPMQFLTLGHQKC